MYSVWSGGIHPFVPRRNTPAASPSEVVYLVLELHSKYYLSLENYHPLLTFRLPNVKVLIKKNLRNVNYYKHDKQHHLRCLGIV